MSRPDYRATRLAEWQDEELVALAQSQSPWSQAATSTLLERYHGKLRVLIWYHTRKQPLNQCDREDAQQNAVFWLMEAVARYEPRHSATAPNCRFATFLKVVVRSRLRNFLKHLWRDQSHYESLARVLPDSLVTGQLLAKGAATDPARLAEAKEFRATLQRVVAELDPHSRQLFKELAAGASLREAARNLGISYAQIKRWRRKLSTELRRQLADEDD
jgi:RNA polymerase sigma factor (sigma-70 family)